MGPRARNTRERILRTARSIFLQRGYGGTRLEDIAQAADLRRTSVYDYFGSKRDLLVALGHAAYEQSEVVIERFEHIPHEWSRNDLTTWLQSHLAVLDEDGAFLTVWAEAAHDDEELRAQALAAERRYARRVGAAMARLGADLGADDTDVGLALLGMIHRVWYFRNLGGDVSRDPAVVETLTAMLAALLTAQQPSRA